MEKNKPKFLRRGKSAKWWLGYESSRSKWLVKSGGDWWVIPRNSAEPKPSPSKYKKKIKKTSNKIYIFLHILAALLGISLAINLLQALF